MGKHRKLKVEEVLGQLVLVLLWLVYLGPNVVNIDLDLFHNVLSIVSSIVEVSEHEHQLLSRLLAEKLEVALEDHFKQSVVGGTVPANVIGPHVDHQYVSDGQG